MKKKTSCEKIEDLLSLYLEGELKEHEAKEVETHLSTCEKCASSLKEWEKCLALLKGALRLEAPSYLWQRIKINLPLREEQKARAKFRWVYAFGFSLLVIICGAMLFQTLNKPRSTPRTTVSAFAPTPTIEKAQPSRPPSPPVTVRPIPRKPATYPQKIQKPRVYASKPKSPVVVARGNINPQRTSPNDVNIEDKILERLQMALLSARSAESSLERTLNALQAGGEL